MKIPFLDRELPAFGNESSVLEEEVTATPAIILELAEPGETSPELRDVGLLLLRLTTGGLLAGHGAQKLFGWFGGPGFKGTAGWLRSMGLHPSKLWATSAASSEFGGGLLTSLGLLHPLGPMAEMAAMIMATVKVHWGKPIWVTTGGAELPVVDMATALALIFTGPGRFSLDRVLGLRLPRPLVIGIAIAEAIMVGIGIVSQPAPIPVTPAETTTADDTMATVDQTSGTL
jgi:putative oxidoreductase